MHSGAFTCQLYLLKRIINVSLWKDPYSLKESNETSDGLKQYQKSDDISKINEENNSMIWTICCNSLNSGEKKTTFQSFLNVMKIKEFSSKNNAEELRFKAHYEVVKERDLGEKIRFLNENHHNSKCTLVSILGKMKNVSNLLITIINCNQLSLLATSKLYLIAFSLWEEKHLRICK